MVNHSTREDTITTKKPGAPIGNNNAAKPPNRHLIPVHATITREQKTWLEQLAHANGTKVSIELRDILQAQMEGMEA